MRPSETTATRRGGRLPLALLLASGLMGGTYPGFRDADIPGLGRTVTFSLRQRF